MKDQQSMNQDYPPPFQEVKVRQACQIQITEREPRNFNDQQRQQEFTEGQIISIITLVIFEFLSLL